jgi:hypothetical protein
MESILRPSVTSGVITVGAGNLYSIFLHKKKNHSCMCNFPKSSTALRVPVSQLRDFTCRSTVLFWVSPLGFVSIILCDAFKEVCIFVSDKCDLQFASGRFKGRKHLYEALFRTGKKTMGNTRNAENCLRWAWHGNSTKFWEIFSVICEFDVGSVRLITGRAQENVWNVCKIVSEVQWNINSEIACRLDFSYGMCQRSIKHVFNMWMVSRNLYPRTLPTSRSSVILLSLKICLWKHTFLTMNTQLPECEHTLPLLWTHLPGCEHTPSGLSIHTFLRTHNFLTVKTHFPYCEHTLYWLWIHTFLAVNTQPSDCEYTPSLLWTHTFLTVKTHLPDCEYTHSWL